MNAVSTNLELPNLPVELPAFWADPTPYVEAARRQHPWLAKFSEGYMVYGYQATKDILAQDNKLQPGFPAVVDFYDLRGSMWGRFVEEMILSQSGAMHTRLRASIASAFTPRQANQTRPLMRQIISDLLDEWAPKGEFDFALFASYFPVAVICGLLGVSTKVIPGIRTAMEAHVNSLTMDPALKPAILEAWDVMWSFADGTVREREARGKTDGDLLDALIAAKNAGQLDETELRFMLLVILIGGYDTSKNMLTITMRMLLERPDMWARCAVDKEFCGKVVDEALRHSAIGTPYRTVSEEFVYEGFRFPRGSMLAFATSLAGRDPDVFSNPLTFDPERSQAKNRHVAFGRGAHICVGQFIAKNQLEEGLHLIAQRLKNPRCTGEIAWRPFLGVWGLKTLPIAFDPA